MTTGPVHEDYKERLGQIVATVSKVLGIRPQKSWGDNVGQPEIEPEASRPTNATTSAPPNCAPTGQLVARRSNDVADLSEC